MRLLIALAALAGCLAAQQWEDRRTLRSLARGNLVHLSLQDAIALALENNLDVELQRLSPAIAETEYKRARAGAILRGIPMTVREGPRSAASADPLASPFTAGSESNLSIAGPTPISTGKLPPAFDPVLAGKLSRTHQSAPQLNSFTVGTSALISDTSSGSIGLQLGFLTGGEVTLGWENLHQSINHRRYDLNPYNSSSFGITFVQPLLRGFGRALNSRFIRVAGNNRQVSQLLLEQQVINTVAAVIRLYWDLAALNEEVRVRRQAVERAERLLADNQAQVEAGTRAPIEVVRAQAEVARTRRDLIAAEALVRQQENILRDYLSRQTVDSPALASLRLIPTEPLRVELPQTLPGLEALAEEALRTRPDLVQARLQLENARTLLEGARDALKPSVDLVAAVRNNGLAGAINPLTVPGAAPHAPDPLLVGGYGSALAQLLRRNFPDYSLGVQVSLPLRNRAAEADYARDRLTLRQQEIRLQQLEKQVRVEIANVLLALEQARAALEAAEQERRYQEQALAAEIEKLSVGASTTFLVIQYQRDLAQAQSAEVAARAACLKTMAALDRARGTLLARYGISLH